MLIIFQAAPSSQYRPGFLRDLGLAPAHHPCDAQRSCCITHQHSGRIEFAFHPIQGGEGFTNTRRAGDDLNRFPGSPFNKNIIIESMQWLTDLQHHVIGGVDNIVDRPHPGKFESALNQAWALADLNVAYQTQQETRVKLGILNVNAGKVRLPRGGWVAASGCLRGFPVMAAISRARPRMLAQRA